MLSVWYELICNLYALRAFVPVFNNYHQMSLTPPPGGGGTPIHYLYGYVPPNGVVILKLLI